MLKTTKNFDQLKSVTGNRVKRLMAKTTSLSFSDEHQSPSIRKRIIGLQIYYLDPTNSPAQFEAKQVEETFIDNGLYCVTYFDEVKRVFIVPITRLIEIRIKEAWEVNTV